MAPPIWCISVATKNLRTWVLQTTNGSAMFEFTCAVLSYFYLFTGLVLSAETSLQNVFPIQHVDTSIRTPMTLWKAEEMMGAECSWVEITVAILTHHSEQGCETGMYKVQLFAVLWVFWTNNLTNILIRRQWTLLPCRKKSLKTSLQKSLQVIYCDFFSLLLPWPCGEVSCFSNKQ